MDKTNDVVDSEHIIKKLVESFIVITKSNEKLAKTILQNNDWDLEKSLIAFYDALENKLGQKRKKAKNTNNLQMALQNNCSLPVSKPSNLYDNSTVESLFGEGKSVTTEPPPRMKFITWNLDCLDTKNLKKRIRAVIKLIQFHEPDIIFFQEVIEEVFTYLESKLPEYKCIKGSNYKYFTMTLLRVFTIYYDNHHIVDYNNSVMGRNLLITEAHLGKLKFQLINTHLESTKDFSSERQNQLKIAFEKCKSFAEDYTVIFGGDLNLRDKEENIPDNFYDLWTFCGSPYHFKYTWDMTRNTNNADFTGFKPRCRFDRVYYRFDVSHKVNPKHFVLIGSQKVRETQSFPSDHWGIVILFDLNHSI